jgi:hypothetical protein
VVHRPLLCCGILKETDRKKESPGKMSTIFLETFEMDSFWNLFFMPSSRRLNVLLLGLLAYEE